MKGKFCIVFHSLFNVETFFYVVFLHLLLCCSSFSFLFHYYPTCGKNVCDDSEWERNVTWNRDSLVHTDKNLLRKTFFSFSFVIMINELFIIFTFIHSLSLIFLSLTLESLSKLKPFSPSKNYFLCCCCCCCCCSSLFTYLVDSKKLLLLIKISLFSFFFVLNENPKMCF